MAIKDYEEVARDIRAAEEQWRSSSVAELPTQYLKEWADRLDKANAEAAADARDEGFEGQVKDSEELQRCILCCFGNVRLSVCVEWKSPYNDSFNKCYFEVWTKGNNKVCFNTFAAALARYNQEKQKGL